MNIGEISKPSVDRAQVDKKLKVDQTDPVLKTQVTSDLVKLSEESQKRYKQENSKRRKVSQKLESKVASDTETVPGSDKDFEHDQELEDRTDMKSPAIDLRV